MWVESRLSGTAGALGALALDIHNWLFRFSCALEELRVVVAELADWIEPPPPPPGCIQNLDGLQVSHSGQSPGSAPSGYRGYHTEGS